jgi:integrase/recombinase XerD
MYAATTIIKRGTSEVNALRLELFDPPPPPIQHRAFEQRAIAGFLACIDNQHTRRAYEQDIAAYFAAVPGGLLAGLDELGAWLQGMREHYAASTVARRVATVRSLFDYARDMGFVEAVPVWKHLHLPPDTKAAVVRVLTVAEVQALVKHTTGAARLAVRLLYGTGMRVAEACGLTWGGLRLDGVKGWARVLGKGGKYRDVGISASLWLRLQHARAGREDNLPVLTVSQSQIDKAIRKAAKLAGLRKVPSAHWLRHSHITHALEAGCSWEEAATQAGHSSIVITQRVYAHLKRGKTSAEYLEDV